MRSIGSVPLHIICDADACTGCGLCAAVCTTGKITKSNEKTPDVSDDAFCISCGQCIAVCPAAALSTDTPAFPMPDERGRSLKTDGDQLAAYLKNRRSIRIWKKKAVTREHLNQLIDVAAYAPSACNIHPVKWVITADPEKIQEFSRRSIDVLRALPADHPMAGAAQMLIAAADAGGDPVCRNAPALLIATSEPDQEFGLIDSIIALSCIDIYAPSIGLGTCWVGYVMIMLRLNPELGKILGIPENWIPQYAMLAGYPAVAFSRIPPRERPDVVWN